jgi:hypothetical protein
MATKHLRTGERNNLTSKFLFEIMTLVSTANNISSDKDFFLRGKSFVYIMINKGPGIDPWGIPYFNVPQSKKKLSVVLRDFTSTFCLLLVK